MIMNQKPYPISFEQQMSQALVCRYGEEMRQYIFKPDINVSGLSCLLQIAKTDGTFTENGVEVHTDPDTGECTLVITIPQQATVVKGLNRYSICVYGSIEGEDHLLYSAEGPLWVDDNLITEDMIASVAEVNGLVFPQDFLTVENLVDIVNYVKAQIIDDQVVNTTQTWSSSKVKNSFDSVNNSVVNLSTTITDMKTGFDGVTYPSPVEMVQGCDQKLHDEILLISNHTNLFDASNATDNKRLDASGNLMNADGYYVSGLIPVDPNFVYAKNSPIIDSYHRFAIYDILKVNISVSQDNIVTIPSNGAYIRICGLMSEKITASVVMVSAVDYVARNSAETAESNIDSKLDKTISGTNIFDKSSSKNEEGYYINENGDFSSNASYGVSYFIPVTELADYYYLDSAGAGSSYNAWYDESKSEISRFQNASFTVRTAPEGAKYFRFSYHLSANVLFAQTSSQIPYEPYKEIDCETVIREVNSKLIDLNTAQYESILGKSGIIADSNSMSANTTITLSDFPFYLKKNVGLSFYGKFSTFAGLTIGKGYNQYRGDWVEIDSTNITFYHYEQSASIIKTVAHELTIADYIMVNIYFDKDANIIVNVNTTSGSFSTYRATDSNVFSYAPFATVAGAMTNVRFSAQSGDIRKSLWVIGDSYFGVMADRVLGQLKNLGYWDGICADGLAGLDSAGAWAEFMKMVNFGRPKYLVWYLGMNDNDSGFATYLTSVKSYCESNGITLILNKVPSVPNNPKENIGSLVVNSGNRYIDSYAAVGANSSGDWYSGYQSANHIHPTQLGALALAQRFAVDVPEVMMYGYESTEVSVTTTGDQ